MQIIFSPFKVILYLIVMKCNSSFMLINIIKNTISMLEFYLTFGSVLGNVLHPYYIMKASSLSLVVPVEAIHSTSTIEPQSIMKFDTQIKSQVSSNR